MKPSHGLVLSLLTSLVCAACSSSSSPSGSTSGAGGSSAQASASSSSSAGVTAGPGSGGSSEANAGTGGATCPPVVVAGDGRSQTLESVQGTVVDPSGAGLAGVPVVVCGLNLCTKNATTNASGTVLVGVGNLSLTEPAFKFGDGYKFARFAFPLPTGSSTITLAQNVVTVALPAAGAAFTPGAASVSGGVTLTLPKQGTASVDTLTYEDVDQQLFRAAEIPIDKAAAIVDPALGLGVLYGVGPVQTVFCPPAQVSIANEPGWPAGTAVEFFVHGVDVSEDWAPYGGWAKVSDGAVSADGKTIATSTGGGLPVLTAFGVRKKT